MRKGFIFNHNRCVGCNACNAACILENGWDVHPRNDLYLKFRSILLVTMSLIFPWPATIVKQRLHGRMPSLAYTQEIIHRCNNN